MFNDDQAINHIVAVLNNLITYCGDCYNSTTNENAQELYQYARDELECVCHDIATSDWDEVDEEDEDEDEEEEGIRNADFEDLVKELDELKNVDH